mmetsp:Transcript_17161/g.38994  ORF Transcript_17161/g.38994 Transcript_17161/m.38994 type:complete len:196 (-) Transcript_17161:878-1465(-)
MANIDPRAKNAVDVHNAQDDPEVIRIQAELELEDSSPERMKLMKRQLVDGVCDCESCRRRRLWIAMRRAHKISSELEQMEELDAMVQNAYQGNSSFVVDLIEKYEFAALEHSGGPVMITGCTACEKFSPDEKCYHCGREPWMATMKNLVRSRKDLGKFPRYICMPVLHAAAWGGSFDLVEKILKYETDVNEQDAS